MKKILCLLWAFLVLPLFAAENKFSWDFSDCEIKDILYAVSLDTGISIVADDTVKGKGNFKFVGSDFEAAFDSFLGAARLFVSKTGDIWTVSRCCVKNLNGSYSLDVCDLTPVQIVEKLSIVVSSVITYDGLPGNPMTMHFKDLSESELLEKVALCFSGYEVVRSEKGYHFSKKTVSKASDYGNSFVKVEKNEKGAFLVDVKNGKLTDVLEKLFETEKSRSYCFLAGAENKVARTLFWGDSFEQTLSRLCAQNGLDCVETEGVFYIVVANGSKEKLVQGEKKWIKIALTYLKADRLIPLMNKRLGQCESIVLPDEFSFLVYITDEQKVCLEELVKEVDVKNQTYLLTLKYITPVEFMKHLPPGVDKNSLFLADDNSCVYFKGTDEAYENLCREIKLCDRPVQRLSYDLLILQYDEGSEKNWNSSFSVNRMSMKDRTGGLVQLGSVLNFNLNVVTAFGLNFAANLQSSIEDNRTKVFADTTLHGVSGKKINFQNTNTYRYRDNNVDPETGKPVYSGVTREIVSGIKIEVMGWVSGEGMITSTVTASVTRQGIDTSSATGNPPPTTEKIITTEVCGKSGEVVVLSGLIQNAQTENEKRTPGISKLPLLGNLFKTKEKISQNSQMVIYMVPHLEQYGELKIQNKNLAEWSEQRCKKFVQNIKEAALPCTAANAEF